MFGQQRWKEREEEKGQEERWRERRRRSPDDRAAYFIFLVPGVGWQSLFLTDSRQEARTGAQGVVLGSFPPCSHLSPPVFASSPSVSMSQIPGDPPGDFSGSSVILMSCTGGYDFLSFSFQTEFWISPAQLLSVALVLSEGEAVDISVFLHSSKVQSALSGPPVLQGECSKLESLFPNHPNGQCYQQLA